MCTRHVFLATVKKLFVEEDWEAEFYNNGSVRFFCLKNQRRYTPLKAVSEFGKNGGCCGTLVSDLTPRSLTLIKGASCNTCFEDATDKDKRALRYTRAGLLDSCGLREMFPAPLSRF